LANCGWLWNDGSFLGWSDGAILTNEANCASEPGGAASTAAAAGGFAASWDYDASRRRKRELARYLALKKIKDSAEYRMLQRKLAMLEEHLNDKPGWYLQAEIEQKIEKIKLRIRMLEDKV
jgi:hypothetical protein